MSYNGNGDMDKNNNYAQDLFKASNLAEINTSWVDIESTNGKDFTENSGKIDLYIPPNIQFFDPSASYLSFDLEIENSDGTPIEPLRQGVSSMFRSVRIYSAGANAQMLEEIDNYSLWVDILYNYTQNLVGDLDKKSMTELVKPWNYLNEPKNEITWTPFKNPLALGTTDISSARTNCKQRINVPLHTGIFRKSEVFCNALVGGIRIEIQLRNTKESYRANVINRDVATFGATHYPVNGAAIGTGALVGTAGITIQNELKKGFHRTDSNYQNSSAPLNLGQTIKLYKVSDTTITNDLGSVTKISTNGGKFRIEFSGTATIGTAITGGTDPAGTNSVYVGVDPTTIAGTYKISNLSMKVCEIQPPQQWVNSLLSMASSSQGWNYDVLSVTNYQNSHNSGNSAIISHIPTTQTRIKSIISAPVSIATATFINNQQKSNYDRYTDYQYFYLNQNQPNERIPLTRIGNNVPEALHLDQVKKALEDGCEYKVQNLREFEDCFVLGRGVSYGKGSLNLEGKDLMLKLNTNSSGLQHNTILNHYVCSIRRIQVSSSGLQVFY
jgi:hypothetical protein